MLPTTRMARPQMKSPRRGTPVADKASVKGGRMLDVDVAAVRLLPSSELPAYTYVPGTDTPHPIRDPRGHSHGRKPPPPMALMAERWADNRTYLWAIDLFNYGFYWEAHEEWERLWRVSGPDNTVGRFLK